MSLLIQYVLVGQHCTGLSGNKTTTDTTTTTHHPTDEIIKMGCFIPLLTITFIHAIATADGIYFFFFLLFFSSFFVAAAPTFGPAYAFTSWLSFSTWETGTRLLLRVYILFYKIEKWKSIAYIAGRRNIIERTGVNLNVHELSGAIQWTLRKPGTNHNANVYMGTGYWPPCCDENDGIGLDPELMPRR